VRKNDTVGTPELQLASFIAKYAPEIAALADAILNRMRKLYPTAVEIVYDNYNALAIGFGPSERASEVMEDASAKAKLPLNAEGKHRIVIKSVSEKQRPRRPA